MGRWWMEGEVSDQGGIGEMGAVEKTTHKVRRCDERRNEGKFNSLVKSKMLPSEKEG